MAMRVRAEIEAEALRMMNEAHNMLSPEARMSALRMKLVEKAEAIIRESVRPMERIEGIKILHVDGLGGSGGGVNGDGSHGGSFSDGLVNSALRFRAQAPLVDQLLREIGLEGGDIQRLVGGASGAPGRAAAGAATKEIAGDPRLRLQRDRRQRRHRLVADPRLQRPAAVASGHRRQPDRERRAERQGRLHPPLPHRATAA